MEFILRCNELKCRTQLHEQAVVTTCSHVFCPRCAEGSGLSSAPNANRQCPACGTALLNPDDVVVAVLNPAEDYKTSVLSGLSPTIIMECASRGLAFYSYQASQEIIYQEHLAKNLTEKYATLSQQMDQLIQDANAQIRTLQEKVHSEYGPRSRHSDLMTSVDMQADQAALEQKNHELATAFRAKANAQSQLQKLYQSLKAQVMASHVANAAGDEAEHALHTVRGDRFVNRIPGTRTGTATYSVSGMAPRQDDRQRYHNRAGSGSSGGSGGRSQAPGIGLPKQAKAYGLGVRGFTGRKSMPAVAFLTMNDAQFIRTID